MFPKLLNVFRNAPCLMLFVAWGILIQAHAFGAKTLETALVGTYAQYFQKGLELYNQGRSDQALAFFERAQEIDAKLPGAYYYQGLCQADLGRFFLANQFFDKALQIKPGQSEVYFQKALVLEKYKQLDNALDALQEVLNINPLHFLAQKKTIQILSQLKRTQEAREKLNAYLTNPQAPLPLFLEAAYFYQKQKDLMQAIAIMETAQKKFPLELSINETLAKLYLKKGEPQVSLSLLNKNRSINPKRSETLFLLQKVEQSMQGVVQK